MDLRQVRQFVDGELSPEEAGVVEQAAGADVALAERISFERKLRERTGVVLEAGSIPAPAEVHQQVEQVVGDEVAHRAAEHDAIVLPQGNPSTIRVNYLAVAACLAIVAGAVLFGIFGTPLHEQMGAGSQPDRVARLADDARDEHTRCATGSVALRQKVRYRDWTSIQNNLSYRLGTTVPVIDLSSLGYALVGGGECSLYPTHEESVHLVYRAIDGSARISLFMQPDRGRSNILDLGDRHTSDGSWNASLLADGQILIVLVACEANAGLRARDLIQLQLHGR